MRSHLVVMVYDVSSDRRRDKLHGFLGKWGVPVQRSAFEARLTPVERRRVLEWVRRIVDHRTDRFVMYVIGEGHERWIEVVGERRPAPPPEPWIIV